MSSSIRIPPHALPWWLYLLLWCYAIQAKRDALQVCTRSETIALTAAHLHKAVGHCFEKMRHYCSETSPKFTAEKGACGEPDHPLSHSHVHFYPRQENWGILALQCLASHSWGGRGSPLTLSVTRKTQSENGQKNNALMQCSWNLWLLSFSSEYLTGTLTIIWSGSLPRRRTKCCLHTCRCVYFWVR